MSHAIAPLQHAIAPLQHAIMPLRHALPLDQACAQENAWMERCAESGQAQLHLWQAPSGWVVPRRYTQAPGWTAVAHNAAVQVRASGGGLVAQGPGIWNMSLIWPDALDAHLHSTAVYTRLCARLAGAFDRLGLATSTGEAPGSLCDGRFNLLAGGRKLAGTAQAWRRIAGQQVGLFHAVMFLRADLEALCAEANRLEELLGHATRYCPQSMTSLHRELRRLADRPTSGIHSEPGCDLTEGSTESDDHEERFLAALSASLQGVLDPLARPRHPVPLGLP